MTTPPWRASGAPSNSNWSIAVTLLTTARPAAKSSTISKLSTIASALTALWVTFLPLTSNSKTTNQNDRFYCPFFRGKPRKDRGKTEGQRRMNGGTTEVLPRYQRDGLMRVARGKGRAARALAWLFHIPQDRVAADGSRPILSAAKNRTSLASSSAPAGQSQSECPAMGSGA